ncbi:MAG: electron transfer flavoprotein subunit beta/FixA family protein [Defluviitaleaceae bacterium]|nr:electron transfer flavoprotein subunit beta/FixA family protein [Defluviitaleaceae bacterium]
MNILVCVKQVPNTQQISIDPETNTLIREGVDSILNTFDGYALEAAARLRDTQPDIKIYTLCMGPPQAEAALRECLAVAADYAFLATDRAFGGSDTLATSYILSSCIRQIEANEGIKFDMVFCGKQAIDGDTAQVGPQIAELLGMAQVTCGLTCEMDGDELRVLVETDDGKAVMVSSLPCVVTFTKPNFDPRMISAKRRIAAKKAEIKRITVDELPGIDRARLGLNGSPTRVRRTFVPQLKKAGVLIKEGTGEDAARKLARLLVDNDVISSVDN